MIQHKQHYEKSCTGMNVFRIGMNSFQNGMNMFRTGMKTFRICTGIWGNKNYQKIRNFSGSKNLKEFFQNSKVLKSSYQTKPNLKSWNFEKILSDSYSLKNFWFIGNLVSPNCSTYPECFHSDSEHINPILEWIHTVLECNHSGSYFLIVHNVPHILCSTEVILRTP